MYVINPGQVVRFLSFLICYTPKRHPPTEGRIWTNSQGRKQRLLKIALLQKAQSLLKIYNTTAFRYYSGNTIAVEKVIWPPHVYSSTNRIKCNTWTTNNREDSSDHVGESTCMSVGESTCGRTDPAVSVLWNASVIPSIFKVICIGNSMICRDIWHKYHKWYFKIVIRNLRQF